MYWIEFLISTAMIVFAGTRLTVCADKLSDELNLGKAWIGIILLGFVTSLPEAITSLVAIVSLGANDLAIGNLLGSNNINPMIIVVMDALYRRGALTNTVEPCPSHKTAASFAILLSCIVIADIIFTVPALNFGRLTVSAGGVMIAACYFAGMRRLARQGAGRSVLAPSRDEAVSKNRPLAGLGAQLLLNAAIVVVGGMWLARSADVIAWQTGLGGTFFGSIFLALVTSLPEVVVSLSAMKIGSLDLALGNIFGSNMTNMFILFVCGLFYRGGAILGAVSKAHVVTAALSVLLTFVAVKGVFTRNKRTVFGLGLDSLIMIVLFFAGTGILYKFRLY